MSETPDGFAMDEVDEDALPRTPLTAEDILSTLAGMLLREPDPVQRWALVQQVRAGIPRTLGWVQALSAGELKADGSSIAEIADKVGVTRQHVDALLRHSDDLGDRPPMDASPAYRYGVYLGYCSAVHHHYGRQRHLRTTDLQAMDPAFTNASVLPKVRDLTIRQLRALRTGTYKNEVTERLDKAGVDMTPMSGHLTVAEQSDVLLGYHHARTEWFRFVESKSKSTRG